MVTELLISPGGFVSWTEIPAALLSFCSLTPHLHLLTLKVSEVVTQIWGQSEWFWIQHPGLPTTLLLTD